MKILYSLIMVSLLVSVGLVTAVPQVIFSDINITINSTTSGNNTVGNYILLGEGLNAATTFVVNGNCSFNYNRANIPLTFSREVAENDTDMATLIRWINENKNMSDQWKECTMNLSVCMNDVGYKGNYTQTKNELDICYRARDDYSRQITELNSKVSTLTSWRNMGVIAGIIGIGLAVYFFRKQMIKTMTNPYSGVSGVAKQY